MIYLDHNATTQPSAAVIDAMTTVMRDNWANPSSKHPAGQAARTMLGEARDKLATLLSAKSQEIVFTSGATESNLHALQGALALPGAPRRVAVSAIEHAGFLKSVASLRNHGVEVMSLPVDAQGRLITDALPELLNRPLALISVMMANNETGVIQPTAELAALTRSRGIPLHVDATQCVGKLPISFADSGIDLLSLSAHKFHGPQGVGALLIRKGVNLPNLIAGQQERGRRGGTENLPGIVGLGVAAQAAQAGMAANHTYLRALHNRLEAGLQAQVIGLTIHGHCAPRLPNTTSLRIAGAHADRVLAHLEHHGICAAAGAACSSTGNSPSHVLLAMGVPPAQAQEAIRLSLGRDNTETDIDATIAALAGLIPDPHVTLPQTAIHHEACIP